MLIGTHNGQYIGKTMCGFKNTWEYCIKINKDEYGYQVEGITNLTEEKGSSGYIRYASEQSLRKSWIIDEDVV